MISLELTDEEAEAVSIALDLLVNRPVKGPVTEEWRRNAISVFWRLEAQRP